MGEKLLRRVEIWVCILCVSGNDIDLMFQCKGKPHLGGKDKIDYIPIRCHMGL